MSKKVMISGLLGISTVLSGCSSIMTRTGPTDGYYPGTKNSVAMLQDDETGWVMKPVIAVDLPLSALLDTLLAPLDYMQDGKDNSLTSPSERVKRLEAAAETAQHHAENPPRD